MRRVFPKKLLVFFLFLSFWFCVPASPLQATPPLERITLSNGLTILLSEEHSLPFVTAQLLIEAGSGKDPAGEEGLARLTAKCLLLGTPGRTAEKISEALDFMGASLNAAPGRDYITVNLRVLSKDLQPGFTLLGETLMTPLFPEEEVKREIEKTLAAILAADEDPGETAEKEFEKTLYVRSPYDHPVEGTGESLQRITGEKVRKFYDTYYRPGTSILTIVGDITAARVRETLVPLLEKWTPGQIPQGRPDTVYTQGPQMSAINRSVTQASIIIGNRGISRDNPDYYALSVMNYILGGGGFSSRLVEEIRNRRGLAYSVTSFLDTGKYPGSFQVTLQTKNASAREAIALVIKELRRMQESYVSEKELEGARKYLTGSFPLRLDTQGKLANFLTQVEYFRLGADYVDRYPSLINAITREDILRVAKTYLDPEKAVTVIVSDLEEAGVEKGITGDREKH
jgi:zinc protease